MNIKWSKRKQMLEDDFLCESLRGRVSYFVTRYRGAHDETGRACVLVDKKEVLNMPFQTEYRILQTVYEKGRKPGKSWRDVEVETTSELAQEGIFGAWDLGDASDEYFQNPIEQSLQSDNLLVRMLAVMDRRVGKRTLKEMEPQIQFWPEWLQYFYRLRIEADSAITEQK